jgi:hypothetical protein
LPYACFLPAADFTGATTELRAPREGDPADYLVVRLADGRAVALTNTCAANALGLVESGDYARGDQEAALAAFAAAGATLRLPAGEVARRMLAASTQAIGDLVASVIHDHHLERPVIVAVGGGAGGLGRAVAGAMKLDIVVPESAEVISAIGDALSLVRAERERTFNQPTPAELQALVAEVEAEAILAGASASTLDVRVEQVVERGAVRVTVTGAVGLNSGAVPGRQPATRAEVSALASARQYADIAPLGQYWFATRVDHGGNVAVFDLYGDLVIDVAGETVDASGATPECIEAAIVRRTKRVGPVSIAPDVWVIGGAASCRSPTPIRAVLETAATLTDGGPTQRSSSGEPDAWLCTSPLLAGAVASSSSRSWRSSSAWSSACSSVASPHRPSTTGSRPYARARNRRPQACASSPSTTRATRSPTRPRTPARTWC